MKIAIVILLFISVAWARTLTETVKDGPAKKLEGLVEDEIVIPDQSRSDASDELAKPQDSDTLNGEMNVLTFGVEGNGSGENPNPPRGPCRKPTRAPSEGPVGNVRPGKPPKPSDRRKPCQD